MYRELFLQGCDIHEVHTRVPTPPLSCVLCPERPTRPPNHSYPPRRIHPLESESLFRKSATKKPPSRVLHPPIPLCHAPTTSISSQSMDPDIRKLHPSRGNRDRNPLHSGCPLASPHPSNIARTIQRTIQQSKRRGKFMRKRELNTYIYSNL